MRSTSKLKLKIKTPNRELLASQSNVDLLKMAFHPQPRSWWPIFPTISARRRYDLHAKKLQAHVLIVL
jgi:RNA recognition motif. (a.k.a. RRM, RBD, or RNP domain)